MKQGKTFQVRRQVGRDDKNAVFSKELARRIGEKYGLRGRADFQRGLNKAALMFQTISGASEPPTATVQKDILTVIKHKSRELRELLDDAPHAVRIRLLRVRSDYELIRRARTELQALEGSAVLAARLPRKSVRQGNAALNTYIRDLADLFERGGRRAASQDRTETGSAFVNFVAECLAPVDSKAGNPHWRGALTKRVQRVLIERKQLLDK